MAVDRGEVASRVAQVRNEMAAAGGVGVSLVAVTKSFGCDAIIAAHDAGCDAIGENYAQELIDKVNTGLPDVEVHFIGHLQSNKVRQLAPHVDLWQSVDSDSSVRELSRHSPGARILVQVNTTGEQSKGGLEPKQVSPFVERCRVAGLVVEGMMTIGPTEGTTSEKARAFTLLRSLVDAEKLPVCSMGMSDDFVTAITCGSTMIRVGSRLFGPRNTRA